MNWWMTEVCRKIDESYNAENSLDQTISHNKRVFWNMFSGRHIWLQLPFVDMSVGDKARDYCNHILFRIVWKWHRFLFNYLVKVEITSTDQMIDAVYESEECNITEFFNLWQILCETLTLFGFFFKFFQNTSAFVFAFQIANSFTLCKLALFSLKRHKIA